MSAKASPASISMRSSNKQANKDKTNPVDSHGGFNSHKKAKAIALAFLSTTHALRLDRWRHQQCNVSRHISEQSHLNRVFTNRFDVAINNFDL